MNNYLGIVFLAVAIIFLAGGVIGQLDNQLGNGQGPNPAVLNGISYLQSQPNLDGGELLTVYLVNQKHPELEIEPIIMDNAPKLDDFHYPLQQFLLNQPIDSAQISEETANAPYYSDFIRYFNCQPLTPDWIDSLNSLSDDDSEFGAYNSSHALLILQLVKNDYFGGRCGNAPELTQVVDSAIQNKSMQLESSLGDRDNFDVWVEKIGTLEFAGQPIPDDAISYIQNQQLANGGWKQAIWIPGNDSADGHTTALAVWALSEAGP